MSLLNKKKNPAGVGEKLIELWNMYQTSCVNEASKRILNFVNEASTRNEYQTLILYMRNVSLPNCL